jgi:hypothetical protein
MATAAAATVVAVVVVVMVVVVVVVVMIDGQCWSMVATTVTACLSKSIQTARQVNRHAETFRQREQEQQTSALLCVFAHSLAR